MNKRKIYNRGDIWKLNLQGTLWLGVNSGPPNHLECRAVRFDLSHKTLSTVSLREKVREKVYFTVIHEKTVKNKLIW